MFISQSLEPYLANITLLVIFTLPGEKDFANLIKELKKGWLRWILQASAMLLQVSMQEGGRRVNFRETGMMTGAEVRAVQPQAEECEQPLEVGKDKERILP